jgi:Flp pilus assembly protein TadG
VEMTFAIVLLMLLTLGVIQVALTLYARNVVAASAHEGARMAIERGRTPEEAAVIARDVVARSTGRLVEKLSVDVSTVQRAGVRLITVRVRGMLRNLGPVPMPIPLSSVAHAEMDEALE